MKAVDTSGDLRPDAAWLEWYARASAARALASRRDALERLCRAREFIDRCHHLPIDVERMACEACFSPYHFIREFRREFGETPHRYLTRRRIDRARELLESSRLSVTEVCLEVGFQSLGSFSTLFSKYVGHPPSRYRAKAFRVAELVRVQPAAAVPFCFATMFVPRAA